MLAVDDALIAELGFGFDSILAAPLNAASWLAEQEQRHELRKDARHLE